MIDHVSTPLTSTLSPVHLFSGVSVWVAGKGEKQGKRKIDMAKWEDVGPGQLYP